MDRGRWTLTALCLATYMLLLDITIVQVAIPSIGRDFGVGLTGLQWTIDAYVLPLAALVITLGTLSDRWGRRRVFLSGVVGFTLASMACGLAQSVTQLDVSRALQGVAGAAMFATTLALVGQEFTGQERRRAILVWGSTVGAAVATGPLVGGLLTEFASWRWIFFVNLPIGIATVLMTIRFVGEGRDEGRPLDIPGLVALSAGLGLLTAGLLRGSASQWHSDVAIVATVGGVLALLVFVVLQRRPHAMIDRTLYRSKAFLGVTGATLTLGAGMFAMILFLNIYLQNVVGSSPLRAGVELLPLTIPVLVVPMLARRAGIVMISGRTIGGGLALVSGGLLLMLWAGATTSWTHLAPGLLTAGIGLGLANPAIAATALAVVPPNRTGLASGVSNACRVAGITVGIAALGAVLRAAISSAIPTTAHVVALISAGQLQVADKVTHDPAAVTHAYDRGLHVTLLVGATTLLVGAVSAFVFVGQPVQALAGPPPAGQPRETQVPAADGVRE